MIARRAVAVGAAVLVLCRLSAVASGAPAGGAAASRDSGQSGAASVAVIRPPPGDPLLQEASARIQLEVAAVGHQSRLVDCPRPEGSEANQCASLSSAVRIWLSREEGAVIIQVVATLADELELRRHVRVVPADGGDDPAVLAVRAVELLRDIYLDVPRVAPPPVRSAAPETAASATEPRAAAISARVSAGIGVLDGRGGLGPSVAPVFGLGETFPHRLAANATVAGPFLNDLAGGLVSVRQWVVLFSLRYELGSSRARLFFGGATGLHYMTVSYSSPMPVAANTSTVAPLLSGEGGASFRLVEWLFLVTEAQVFFTRPANEVSSLNGTLGRAGAPSLLLDLSLSVSFP